MTSALRQATDGDAWVLRVAASETSASSAIHPGLSIERDADARVAFSGTLFEPEELAERLKLAGNERRGPAALVLRAYHQLGDDWPSALHGHFAVIVDDRRRERVTAVRDATGQHPLFFADGSEGLLFSWSTDALLAQPGVSRALNRVALAEHLVHRWSDPVETYYSAIWRVPPGHVFVADQTGRRLRRYFDPSSKGAIQWLRDHERDHEIERFGELFERAVTRCLRHGRTGIFLSGGLDSISIAATAVKAAPRLGQAVPRALSLGFPDPACNEEPVQRGAAQSLGMPQEFVPFGTAVEGRGFLRAAIEMAAIWPVPMMNLWNPAYHYLGRRGRDQGCRVILTGTGGDEWLTVSPYLAADLMRQGRAIDVVRFIRTIQKSHKMSHADALRGALWTFGLRPIAGMLINRLVPAYWQGRRRDRLVASTPPWVAPDPSLRRQIDERADRVLGQSEPYGGSFYEQGMRSGLEHPLNAIEAEEYFELGRRLDVRILHPYLDADLVDLLYRTPPRLLMAGGRAKGLVRETLARRFPNLGFERQRKVHATDFYRRMMRTEGSAAWASLGGAATLGKLGVVDAGRHATAMLELADGRRPRESYGIWTSLQLEAWVRSRA